ncbi:14320_t:CDS:2, partial [Dentiscutata erythropus]
MFQMACAFCFAIQTYAQLVLFHQATTSSLKRFFQCFVIIYPIVMLSILIGLSLRFHTVKPRRMNCDVTDPAWVRLFSFSGINQLCSIPGVILSGRAAYEVYKHMDLLRSSSSHSNSSTEVITQDSSIQRPKFSRDPFSKKSKSYSVTKAAAIRMVTFSLLFALINLFACITSFSAIFKDVSIDREPSSVDFV